MSVPAGLSINEPPLRLGVSAGEVAQCHLACVRPWDQSQHHRNWMWWRSIPITPALERRRMRRPQMAIATQPLEGQPALQELCLGGEVGSRAKPLAPWGRHQLDEGMS